jgi:5-methylcytosine-specific restriction endonuclease McrA
LPSRISFYRPTHLQAPADAYRRLASRVEANRFYASTRWRNLREAYLSVFPLCEECHLNGRATAAIDVHHKLERRDHPEHAFDWENLQALCKACHGRKRDQ